MTPPDSLDDPLPVDDARLDDVEDLEHDEPVVEVAVQVVDVRVHTQGVHPVAVHWKANRVGQRCQLAKSGKPGTQKKGFFF